MSRWFPRNFEGNAGCTLMFPVSVCLRIESKRFVEEETQRKRLQDGSVDRMEEAIANEDHGGIHSKRVQCHAGLIGLNNISPSPALRIVTNALVPSPALAAL